MENPSKRVNTCEKFYSALQRLEVDFNEASVECPWMGADVPMSGFCFGILYRGGCLIICSLANFV